MTVRFPVSLFLCAAALISPASLSAGDKANAPVVTVASPLTRQVTDTKVFTGRVEAAQSIQVRARVTGYLVKTAFKEGSAVNLGDLLFDIDPRPYQARVAQKLAEVNVQKAALGQAKITYENALALNKSARVISAREVALNRAALDAAEARVQVAMATLDLAKLELDFTHVRAPISGTIGRASVTPGNLVTEDKTLLATIVSLEPMFVYFNIDEVTLLRSYRALDAGKIKQPLGPSMPVTMALGDEDDFPHSGSINFVDNQFNAATGSIAVRAVFANPRRASGTHLLMPGMAVRVKLSIGTRTALFVPQTAILPLPPGAPDPLSLFVANKNTVERRKVILGEATDGYREVHSGLAPDDLVVLDPKGLKARTVVQPKRTTLQDSAPK
jgi:RND family efflux transporter MFP subunit